MRCPTCAAEIEDRAICHRCGTAPGVEARVQKVKARLKNFIDEKGTILPSRLEAHHFLWACALVPIFLVPPLVSLVYSIVAMRRERTQSVVVDFEWIAILSAINLVVSVLLLHKWNLALADFWSQGQSIFSVFISRLLQIFSIPQPGPAPISV